MSTSVLVTFLISSYFSLRKFISKYVIYYCFYVSFDYSVTISTYAYDKFNFLSKSSYLFLTSPYYYSN